MVTLALRPTTELLRTLATAEPHPPLYPLLLKAWMRLAGTGELAVRMPSVWAGTALVPVLAALGRTVGMRAAVTAALLTAFSPFLLWYATEARMYPLAVLFGAAAFYWLARLLRRPSRASYRFRSGRSQSRARRPWRESGAPGPSCRPEEP